MIVAVMPARGGSRRIPRKSVRPFCGTPILVRTLRILERTRLFDRIVVSTDDDEIARLATDAGAAVPFRRPDELADDFTPTRAVVAHALRFLEEQGGPEIELVCCVYPTAALTMPGDYRQARELLRNGRADYVFAGTAFPHPIQRAFRILEDSTCEMIWPEHRSSRTQDLEPAYHDAGQFYFGRREAWLEPDRPWVRRMILLPRHRAVDIDTLEDWELAERAALGVDFGGPDSDQPGGEDARQDL